MIFSLEVMQALEGDSLILHFGTKENPQIIVIDGGPGGVYKNFLKPRLLQIKTKLSPISPLPLSMVMVSHLDDDHVNGILKLTDDAINDTNFKIENLWFNAFDDIIGNIQIPVISSIGASAASADMTDLPDGFAGMDHHASAVIASTGQGRKLRNDADTLNASVNNPFLPMAAGMPNLVHGGEIANGSNQIIDWGGNNADLKITVLHPNRQRLLELQSKWDEDLKKAKAKGDDSIIFASLANPDTSPFNLSSIVCLVKSNGKTMLLTGDGRDDDIMEGLKKNNLLDANGKCKVDILKIPHHGSDRNSSVKFYQTVVAKHYVISANGKHKNPDRSMLDMLAEGTKGRNNFTLHLTNNEGRDRDFELKPVLDDFIATQRANGRTFKVKFRNPASSSIVLNLLDGITY
jgi:hypothetical protein